MVVRLVQPENILLQLVIAPFENPEISTAERPVQPCTREAIVSAFAVERLLRSSVPVRFAQYMNRPPISRALLVSR